MILEVIENKLEFTINLNWETIIDYNNKLNNKDKNYFVSEDTEIIGNSDTEFGKDKQRKTVNDANKHLVSIFEKSITQIVQKVISSFTGYSIVKNYASNFRGFKEVSFAYYYHINKYLTCDNMSKDLNKILSYFVIRFANHISNKEKKDLGNLLITQKMHIKLPPLTKEFVETCVFNIIELHADMLEHIENHPEIEFDTIESLGQKYVNKLKELQIQGDFSDQF